MRANPYLLSMLSMVRTTNGYHPPPLTNCEELPLAAIPVPMFTCGRGENFVMYMKERLGLDQWLGYSWSPTAPPATSRSPKGQGRLMRQIEAELAALQEQGSMLPTHVALQQAGRREMRLGQQVIIDLTKLIAYNADERPLGRVAVHYPNPNGIWLLLRSFAKLSGKARSTDEGVVGHPRSPRGSSSP